VTVELRIIYIMSTAKYRRIGIQSLKTKRGQCIQHPIILPCGASLGDRDPRIPTSQPVNQRGHVLTHMSPLAQKDGNNENRLATRSHEFPARGQQVRRHHLQKCRPYIEVEALGADPPGEIIERFTPT